MYRTIINEMTYKRVKIIVTGLRKKEELIGEIYSDDDIGIYFIPEDKPKMIITWGSLVRVEEVKT